MEEKWQRLKAIINEATVRRKLKIRKRKLGYKDWWDRSCTRQNMEVQEKIQEQLEERKRQEKRLPEGKEGMERPAEKETKRKKRGGSWPC